MSRPGEGETVVLEDGMLIMSQHLSNGKGTKYETRVLVKADGGSITTKNNKLIVSKANSLEIRIIAWN